VSAIPQIAECQRLATANDAGCRCVVALRYYTSRDAAQAMAPLVIDADKYTRINAALAIQGLPSTGWSSAPCLMLAVVDPDPQGIVPLIALGSLHRIAPDLGPVDEMRYFMEHHDAEVKETYEWWSQILNGKTVAGSVDYKKWMSALPRTPSNNVQFLFSPNKLDRERAIKSLAGTSDSSMIPYFVLAIRDPDDTVAYAAYASIAKLLPKAFAPVTRPEFAIAHEKLTKTAEDWWRDELLGKHQPATHD